MRKVRESDQAILSEAECKASHASCGNIGATVKRPLWGFVRAQPELESGIHEEWL